ncbi:peroxiredoxin [Solilutibacter silvestris]|uniref:Glutathione-dependent peroxiredoxin n=1 Tax=Solilutibacter silvestris TaxID=1645665 RepID=A0A2K1PZI0_9GAMM|nr:peroxiredoxin [Lysobacter silvestris]PNS08195.1 Peroxiredoxin [Lysobacter silvestris]
MSIQPGDPIPSMPLQVATADGAQDSDTSQLFDGKRVLLFSVPGAFTPTCSERHLPGYVQHHDEFAKRGIAVYCLSVNDPFVMQAWGESQHIPAGLLMLADGNGAFTRALGLEMDASKFGMGVRGKRFALYAENGVARAVEVEAPGEFRVSSAEAMLDTIAALPPA